MAIRHQPQSEKHPYASPTTPGLFVTFRAYIIELLCLNTNQRIGPRFWSDKKFWGPKFRREVKGVDNVITQLDKIDAITQTAFIQVVQKHNLKSLTYKTTVKRVVRDIGKRKTVLETERVLLSEKPQNVSIDIQKNAIFVDTGKKNTFSKIRDIESGQKKI